MPRARHLLLLAAAVLTAGIVLASSTSLLVPQKAGAATFIAACTGTTSDAGLIQGKINGSSAGDEIVIRGACLINATVKLLGDRTYRGDARSFTAGGNSVLTQNAGMTGPLLASDSWVDNSTVAGGAVTIRDMSLRGNGGPTTTGIELRSWRSRVEGVHIEGFGRDGISLSVTGRSGAVLSSTMVGGTIRGNVIKDVGRYGIGNDNASGALITDWWLSDNDISDALSDCIHLTNSAGWYVRGNHLYGCRGNGIWANRSYSTSVTDNLVEDFGFDQTGGTFSGIFVNLVSGWNSTVANNRVYNANPHMDDVVTYRYLYVEGSAGSGRATVTGNAVLDAGKGVRQGLVYNKNNAASLEIASTGNQASGFPTGKDRVILGSVALSGGL